MGDGERQSTHRERGTAEFAARLPSLNQILTIIRRPRQRTRPASFQSACDAIEIAASKLPILRAKSDKSPAFGWLFTAIRPVWGYSANTRTSGQSHATPN